MNGAIMADKRKFALDKRKQGWKLNEDVGFEPKVTAVTEFELVEYLKKGETFITGDELVRRAKAELAANLGQRHLEWLLDHTEDIPYWWKKFYIVAPGTKWFRPDHFRVIPGLTWMGNHWDISFDWVGAGHWFEQSRLLRINAAIKSE
jgi:hypothetical protein